jgi:hypothetical protein
MLLSGGPLAVLGLPDFPAHPSAKTAAAAVLGLIVTRANDVYNMRINNVLEADRNSAAVRSGPNETPRMQWSSVARSEGDAFCACLRVQRVWRGHCDRMRAHICRLRLTPAAAFTVPSDSTSGVPLDSPVAQRLDAPLADSNDQDLGSSVHRAQANQDVTGPAPLHSRDAAAVDESAYLIPHPANFVPPCALCELFDHSTLEHSRRVCAVAMPLHQEQSLRCCCPSRISSGPTARF